MLIPLDLDRLAADHGPARVSMFLPTICNGYGTAENRRLLENLLRLVDIQLRTDGLADEADTVVAAIRRSVDEWWRWRNPRDGLAVFADPGHIHYFRVPLPLPELVSIGRRFLVGPLLPLLAAQQHFFVLSIDPEDVRLFTANRFRLDEVPLDGSSLPGLAAARRQHGSGGAIGERQESVIQLFRRVDGAVREALADERAPLVLAGVPSRQSLYRKVNTYPYLQPEGVEGSLPDIPFDVLRSKAFSIAEPELLADECAAAGRYRELRGTGRTSSRPEEVLTAAEQGRVETLFLSTDTWCPEPSAGPAMVRCQPSPSVGEQLEAAALATFGRGGTILTVPAVRMPDATSGAAVFRY